MLRIPYCLNNRLTDGGKVVSLTHWPRPTPKKHFSASVVQEPYERWNSCLYVTAGTRVCFAGIFGLHSTKHPSTSEDKTLDKSRSLASIPLISHHSHLSENSLLNKWYIAGTAQSVKRQATECTIGVLFRVLASFFLLLIGLRLDPGTTQCPVKWIPYLLVVHPVVFCGIHTRGQTVPYTKGLELGKQKHSNFHQTTF
jgi:hypothetical protein